MEKIVSIRSLDDFEFPDDDDYEGYEVVTDKQRILFGISNQSGCCENWGHVASEDNLEQFVGADLLEITKTDEGFETTKLGVGDVYDGGAVFVTFKTSNGPLQFAVYNSHNGYYGHNVRFESEQLKFEECV